MRRNATLLSWMLEPTVAIGSGWRRTPIVRRVGQDLVPAATDQDEAAEPTATHHLFGSGRGFRLTPQPAFLTNIRLRRRIHPICGVALGQAPRRTWVRLRNHRSPAIRASAPPRSNW
jgi:hypothetical protein